MTTLNIGGKKVTVSDDFLKLSPEQQNETVEEIAQSMTPVSQTEDVARAGLSGLRQGIESTVGMFGDAAQMQGGLAGWLAGKLGASPETQETVRGWGETLSPSAMLPKTDEIRAVTDKVVGEGYEPQTVKGEYARSIGQFVPGAVSSPGGLLRKTAMAVVPAIASETAGQVTKGTTYEKYARAAAALVSGAPVAFFGQAGKGSASAVKRAIEGATPQQIDKAESLFLDAQAAGVPITRFEAIQQATGNATRAGDIQRVVEGQGGLRDFFASRPGQVRDAASRELSQIAPAPAAPSTIGPAIGREAENIATDVRQGINRVTEPLYTQAGPQRIDPATFAKVEAAPGWKEASSAVRGDPQLARYVEGMPDDSVAFLNEVQKYLAQQSDNAAGAINAQKNMQRSAGYSQDATTVRGAAEQASPAFKQAVEQQANLRAKFLDPLLQGPLGKLAAKDTTTQNAIEALFPRNPLPNSQQEISSTVAMLANKNDRAARELVRAHVESTFNQATRELQSGANQFGGAGFVAALRGNQQQAANLEAAVKALPGGGKLWDGFDRFLNILEAHGTRQRVGSQTAFNTELLQDLKQGSTLGTTATLAAGGGLSWPRKALDVVERWRLGRNVEQIAKLITDPMAGRAFRDLASAKGRRARNIAVSLTFMGNSALPKP